MPCVIECSDLISRCVLRTNDISTISIPFNLVGISVKNMEGFLAVVSQPLSGLSKGGGLLLQDTLLLAMVGLALLLALALIVRLLHNRKRNRRSATTSSRNRSSRSRIPEETGEPLTERIRRRKKKRRHPHRERKPTLSETGGLPPQREDESGNSAS
jgi:hypothetical protein